MEARWYRIVAVLFIGLIAITGVISVKPLLVGAPAGTAAESAINGGFQRALEGRFDEAFPGRRLSLNLWTAFEVALFGDGRPGVVIGRDGWLYTDEEFKVADRADAHFDANIAYIRSVKAELAAAGIPLLVTVIPAKADIYPEYFGDREPAAAQRSLHARTLAALAAADVATVDLMPAIEAGDNLGLTFFRTDTHWTPLGARLAAESVVQAMRKLALADDSTRKGDYRMTVTGEQPHRGDLLSFLPLDPYFESLMPKVDSVVIETVEAPTPSDTSDDLFGDNGNTPSVALVGSSYSANPLWNYRGWLEAGLDEPVANYAKEAVGPFPPMAAYLRSDDLRQQKPRVVVWELPLRAMLSPVDPKLMQAPVATVAARSH